MRYKNGYAKYNDFIYFGCYPFKKVLNSLSSEGVGMVWNLLEEEDSCHKAEREIIQNVIWTPIADYSIPHDGESFIQDLNKVAGFVRNGGKVFVHCMGGRGRTGMVLACLLMELEGLYPETALALTKVLCNGPEEESQKEFVVWVNSKIKDK